MATNVLLLVCYETMEGEVTPLYVMKGHEGSKGITLFLPWHYMALWSHLHCPANLPKETALGVAPAQNLHTVT
jgi:hypothetical protein